MTSFLTKEHPLNTPQRGVIATLITAKLKASLSAYQEELGYKLVERETVSKGLAQHWQQSELEGCEMALLKPASGAPVFLRFIGVPTATPITPKTGWFALEICVKDVYALHKTLVSGSNFTPFAEPKPLPFTDKVVPMQCKGPRGEILYLNEVRGNLPDIDLPLAQSQVDHLFISILSANDMEESISFYEELLDIRVNERHEIPYKTINRVYGLPLETKHKLATLGVPRSVTLEIDQTPSPKQPSEKLTEGIWMISFTVDALDKAQGKIFSVGQAPYNGAKAVTINGPSGEKVELIKLTS